MPVAGTTRVHFIWRMPISRTAGVHFVAAIAVVGVMDQNMAFADCVCMQASYIEIVNR